MMTVGFLTEICAVPFETVRLTKTVNFHEYRVLCAAKARRK
jgi:hypothetical protein